MEELRLLSNKINTYVKENWRRSMNGPTEGCNNKIKVLKRNAYGYRNFARFRNRILHIFHHKHFAIEKVAA